MSASFSLATVQQLLTTHVQTQRSWQINEPAAPDHGGIYQSADGIANPRATGIFITFCGYLTLASALAGVPPDEALLAQANDAADYLLRSRRPSGLIDLISVNIDSAPDTAFAVQELCTLLELARVQALDPPGWQSLLAKIETFVREAVPGMLRGGFHTPNHRWVITAALLQAHALFPDLQVQAVVERYLAETVDIDDEGMFLERSIGVYDAVNNRSLLLIYEQLDLDEAWQAVDRNLETDLHLLHADGTAETGISRRQDYGTRHVALGLVPYLLWSHQLHANQRYLQSAAALWSHFLAQSHVESNDRITHIGWLAYVLLKYGAVAAVAPALPDEYVRHFPLNGIHRVRRGPLSATFFRGVTRLLTLTSGQAELSSVKMSQTYFGQYTGRFLAEEMHYTDAKLVLRSEGRTNPRRPAYELPLGRPVPPAEWNERLAERELRWLPHAVTTLTVTEVGESSHGPGFDLHFQTLQGTDQVATQIAFDFPAGGIWETADNRVMTSAGQTIFLKRGWGAMRYGADVIHLGPGHITHGMWQLREAEAAPDHVRVLLTFFTPLDCTIQVRTTRGPKLPIDG